MRCLIFCDKAHEIYLNLLTTYPAPDLNIVRVYICGEMFESSCDITLYPLNTITDKQSFDSAIVFLSDTSLVLQLLSKVYGDNVEIPVYDYNSFSKVCLSGKGHLELVRRDIELKCPSDHHLIMGNFSYYNSIVVMDEINDGSVKVQVGKFCSFGPEINFMLAVEHKSSWNTTYPFYRLLGTESKDNSSVTSKGDIVIGNDVWIGSNATILSGVTIGDGCIVGSHTVVTKSVEPYSVIVGNPGKIVKKRFSQDVIDKLSEIKWWDWDLQLIFDALPIIQSEDIDSLYSFWQENVNL